MMEAARTTETSVDIQLRTRQYIPENSELHTRRRENLSHTAIRFESQNLLGCTAMFLNWMSTDVSEGRAASIISAMSRPDDGGSAHL
jgi:hypothetical protein